MATKGISFQLKNLPADPTKERMDALRETFQYLGETGVNEARSYTKRDDWHDQTSNLRSSIGYAVFDNGKILGEDTRVTSESETGGGHQGVEAAKALLASMRAKFPKKLAVVVCAGMSYASDVQARGRNVLTSANTKVDAAAKKIIPQSMR